MRLPGDVVARVNALLAKRDAKPRRPATADQVGVRALADDTAELYIYDEIGYWGVTAGDVAFVLSQVTSPKLTVRLNSPGGDVFDGVAIYNLLLDHAAMVDVVVDGLAASAASFIAMAGETVTANSGSQFMIHDAWGLAIGNAADMTEMASVLEKTSAMIASIYAERAGGEADGWRTAMLAETWYSAQEAVDAGLADEVVTRPQRGGDDEPAPDDDAEASAKDEGRIRVLAMRADLLAARYRGLR